MAIFKNAALLSSLAVLALSGISCSRSSQAQTEPAKPAPPSQTSSPVPAPAKPPQGFAVFAIAQPPETPPAEAQPPDRILRSGHSADIDAVAFSPDARWLASGSYDKTIRIWDLSTGRSVRMLAGHTNDVWSLSFSPDGKRLVSTSQDGTARVWDANTWTALFTLTPSGMPTDAAFSLDSKFLILACQSKDEEGGGASIEIYDAAGGNKLRGITMDWGRPYPLIVTPNGRILSSGGGGEDGDVNVATKVWDLTTGRELKSLPLAAEAISPDGRQIAAVASSPQGAKITLYDADTGKPLRTFDPSGSNVGHLTFSPDGTRLLAALGNGPVSGSGSTIEVWDTATGKALESLPGDKNSGLHALAISSDGKFLAAGNYAGASTRIWDLATATVVRTLEGQSFSGSLAFDLEGRLLVSESAGVRLWDVAAGEDLGVVPGVGGGQLVFSPDGNWLASNPQGALKVWNTKTWTAPNLSPPGVYMWWIGFAGPQLPPTIADSGVKAWQVADPSTLLSLLGSSNAMAVSPDRRLMAVGRQRGGDVDLWDLATSKKLVTLPAHKISVNRLAFSPDGKLLLTAGQETPITPAMISAHQLSVESAAKLWDVNTWTARSSMSYTGMGVGVGEFSRDSRFLAFTRPGLIELFEISTGKSVKRLAIDYPAGPVAFSPNGDWLASISQQGVVAWKLAASSK